MNYVTDVAGALQRTAASITGYITECTLRRVVSRYRRRREDDRPDRFLLDYIDVEKQRVIRFDMPEIGSALGDIPTACKAGQRSYRRLPLIWNLPAWLTLARARPQPDAREFGTARSLVLV
jgi:hypothetical protein